MMNSKVRETSQQPLVGAVYALSLIEARISVTLAAPPPAWRRRRWRSIQLSLSLSLDPYPIRLGDQF